MKRIETKKLLPGDTVHVLTPEGSFLENATVTNNEEHSVFYTLEGQTYRAGHLTGHTYILVKREEPLPTEIGATYKGYIRITKDLWVSLEPTTDYEGKINTYTNEVLCVILKQAD